MLKQLALILILSTTLVSAYQPVPVVNTTEYLGRWYQVIGSDYNLFFMSNGTCVTADYGLDGNNITVLNRQLYKGKMESISGYAIGTNPDLQGELKVYLEGVPVPGQYWIYDLGEIIGNQYSYSIVSDEFYITLFVLVRDLVYYNKYLKDQLGQEIANLGFKEIYNVDQSNCTYP